MWKYTRKIFHGDFNEIPCKILHEITMENVVFHGNPMESSWKFLRVLFRIEFHGV